MGAYSDLLVPNLFCHVFTLYASALWLWWDGTLPQDGSTGFSFTHQQAGKEQVPNILLVDFSFIAVLVN